MGYRDMLERHQELSDRVSTLTYEERREMEGLEEAMDHICEQQILLRA